MRVAPLHARNLPFQLNDPAHIEERNAGVVGCRAERY
jgi:hypothetical protein